MFKECHTCFFLLLPVSLQTRTDMPECHKTLYTDMKITHRIWAAYISKFPSNSKHLINPRSITLCCLKVGFSLILIRSFLWIHLSHFSETMLITHLAGTKKTKTNSTCDHRFRLGSLTPYTFQTAVLTSVVLYSHCSSC